MRRRWWRTGTGSALAPSGWLQHSGRAGLKPTWISSLPEVWLRIAREHRQEGAFSGVSLGAARCWKGHVLFCPLAQFWSLIDRDTYLLKWSGFKGPKGISLHWNQVTSRELDLTRAVLWGLEESAWEQSGGSCVCHKAIGWLSRKWVMKVPSMGGRNIEQKCHRPHNFVEIWPCFPQPIFLKPISWSKKLQV